MTRFYQRVQFCILKFHVTNTIQWYNTPHPQKLHSSWRLAVFFEAPTRAIRLAMRGQRLGTRLPLSQPTPRCKLHRKLDCELHEHLVISSLPQNTSETSASLNLNLLFFFTDSWCLQFYLLLQHLAQASRICSFTFSPFCLLRFVQAEWLGRSPGSSCHWRSWFIFCIAWGLKFDWYIE